MTLKLTYGQLRDPNFGRAFGKVASHSGYKSVPLAINIAKMNKRLLEEAKTADEQYLSLAKKHAELDDAGEFKTPEDQPPGTFKIASDKGEEWKAALKEFNAYSFDFPGSSLRVDDILPAGLSPLDLSFLDDLLAPVLESVPQS